VGVGWVLGGYISMAVDVTAESTLMTVAGPAVRPHTINSSEGTRCASAEMMHSLIDRVR
jgi:hypothetical protein